ncbi:MAG: efflux RND transporter periplasmic adaptor subunit, partial [Gammaproteobacteria bacterium]
MKGKNALAVVTVTLVVLVLAGLILSMDNPSGDRAEAEHDATPAAHEEEKEGDQGLHGRRLAQDGFEIEIGLSEAEDAPHFQAAAYEDKKPVSPEAVQLTLDLQRPGKEPETLYFQVEGDHLRSPEAIAEPHVFAVKAVAQYQGKTYRWDYWQVEGGIELPSGAVEEAGIEVKPAGPAALKTVLALPGEIQLNPRRVAHVVPRVEGVVVEVRKELGDR